MRRGLLRGGSSRQQQLQGAARHQHSGQACHGRPSAPRQRGLVGASPPDPEAVCSLAAGGPPGGVSTEASVAQGSQSPEGAAAAAGQGWGRFWGEGPHVAEGPWTRGPCGPLVPGEHAREIGRGPTSDSTEQVGGTRLEVGRPEWVTEAAHSSGVARARGVEARRGKGHEGPASSAGGARVFSG